jgi:hypothetical protein
MRNIILIFLLIGILVTSGCTPAAPASTAAASACPDLIKVANAFYTANDAAQLVSSMAFFTEDVIMVFWAEGINGHHMGQKVVIGKDQFAAELNDPGLHLKASSSALPNFQIDTINQAGNQLTFHLTPDRVHADGRPFDPYVVEMVFSGCRIEILKIIERITWV